MLGIVGLRWGVVSYARICGEKMGGIEIGGGRGRERERGDGTYACTCKKGSCSFVEDIILLEEPLLCSRVQRCESPVRLSR